MNELDFEQKTVLEKQVAKKKLTVKKLNETELEDLKRKEITSTKLTKQDVSVYAYAKELNATILTSDNRLRKEAKAKGFEVHGILWVFETMMQEKLMKPKKASEKLTELMKINTWLPMDECRKRIEKWNSL
jgi:predicted nucleic acid-binding protein